LGPDANTPLNTDEQLKVFDELVSTIDRVYLYPDFNGVDWKSIVATYRAKVKNGMDTETFYKKLQNLISELGDEHSYFQSPSEIMAENARLAGRSQFVGIGVFAQLLLDTDHTTILSVLPDSPAEHSGLQPHDDLLAVDDLPLFENGKLHNERLLGPECSAVRMTVRFPGSGPRDMIMIRRKMAVSIPIEARLVPTTDGSHIGYIFIPTFLDETIPDQVRKALSDFGTLDGLILDNRMNGGGLGSAMQTILGYFTSGNMGQFVSRTEKRPLTIKANPINNSQTVPIVVLVGKNTVSFGEVFSGIMQDVGRAKVVGETTLGNVETLHGHDFSDGSRAWIAQERFDPVNSHANWEQTGIIPDVQVPANWDTFTFENDPAFPKALEILGHK